MSIKLQITVTKEILEKAKWCGDKEKMPLKEYYKGTGVNCAIALAVRDIFPDAMISDTSLHFDYRQVGNLMAPIAPLPDYVRRFIKKFDSYSATERVKMNPISFEINVPDEVIEKINIDEIRPLLENHSTLKLIEQ